VAGVEVGLEEGLGAPAVRARILATYLAGSQYITWLSFSDVLRRMAG
jgi:hypothetical protein